MKPRCTTSAQRYVTRHLHDAVLERMQQRATPAMMRLRRSTAEHPFASLKYHIFGDGRFLLRGLKGAQSEISLATMAYNLKRMMKVLGGREVLSTRDKILGVGAAFSGLYCVAVSFMLNQGEAQKRFLISLGIFIGCFIFVRQKKGVAIGIAAFVLLRLAWGIVTAMAQGSRLW